MTTEQYFKNLTPPTRKVDVVLDTDAYNEIDDQFAIAYLLRQPELFNVVGLTAAPFLNERSVSPLDGMEKSYTEILTLLELMGLDDMKDKVYKGSADYLPDIKTPVESDAADFLARLADDYCPENPLYVVAIGAITNVASALLKNPAMKENCVVVWLGGHAENYPKAAVEFNMKQDIAAARVVMGCGVPFVQLPCRGVVDHFATSRYELEHWLSGVSPLCDHLIGAAIAEAESYAAGKPWTRVIWDVTAVAWLKNSDRRFMREKLIHSPIPEYDKQYAYDPTGHLIKYVYEINRDALFEDLFKVLKG
ncbi:MAG: nucleoside hydrolase [Clostridia bacterium]|nr:nucleoside hydrolase [Clostridia bacterium]